jgi:hypothetical protein
MKDSLHRGLAREYRGRLIPVMKGGDPAADDSPFPVVPEDLAALTVEDLAALEAGIAEAIASVGAAPAEFVGEARTADELIGLMTEAVTGLEAVKAELAKREADEEDEEVEEAEEPTEAELAAIAELAASVVEEPTVVVEVVEAEPVLEAEPIVAAATPAARRLPPPARSRAAAPVEAEQVVSLVAGASAPDLPLGTAFPDMDAVAREMISRRRSFGIVSEGASGQTDVIARADWSNLYPEGRKLGMDEIKNEQLVAAAIDQKAITAELVRRRNQARQIAQAEGDTSLVASGGLCAPVTPYYQLQMVSITDRPVRGALPSFNADRGGIRYGAPPTLGSVVGGAAVGGITAAQDAFPGSSAQKTCLTLPCPPFSEVDVTAIFHCVQTGNLGARTYPERIAHYNNLVLAAQARFAESLLLTAIDSASTQVTAGNLGLGASATLFSQWLAAANAMRNRHRMDPDAVLRLFVPEWVTDLITSDVIRGQFQRFDTSEADITALLRSFYIEPTYYIDGANGRAQVFGTQGAGALLPFPATIVSYLFPEGSFLHLDAGTLELGLVRDSVLNKTNDFQIFGETFENVAFVGVESMAIASSTCDVGIVAGTHNSICPINYGLSS